MSSASQPRRIWQPPTVAELQAVLPAFAVHEFIEQGGMGAVFKATQRSLNRLVAIKVLPARLVEGSNTDFAARFRQEALTMAKLAHPGIVSVFESGEAGGLLYIVMEFVDGTDVARMIAGEGKLPPELATKLLTQACDALHYAHEHGVIHRDIKPANLLVARDGTVKIADFGLAKHDDVALLGLTQANVAIGTPDFLAPEAWKPNTALDRRSDLYAVGVTLYQMLTGEVPRGRWKMPSVRVGTDPRFDAIIERALQPQPEARYQSSVEMRRDLETILAGPGQGGSARAASGESKDPPRSARLTTATSFAAVAVLFAIVVGVVWWMRPPAPEPRMGLVTTAADRGRGSLRQVIFQATNGATITFATNLSGATLRLTRGEIVVDKNLDVDASALTDGVTLDGNGASRIFKFVRSTNTLTALTITNGNDRTGGALLNDHGAVTLNGCTLMGNRTSRGSLPDASGVGGAIFSDGALALNQCTLTGNTSEQGGAVGLSQSGVVNLIHCTVVSNTATGGQGGGISGQPGSQLILRNSIVAGNHASNAPNIAGSFILRGTNLIDTDPQLAALGRHGGPTRTMPPLPGSPAIDRCTNAPVFPTDQRGTNHLRVMNAYADIGAVEALVPSIPNASFEAESFNITPGGAYLNHSDITGWTMSNPVTTGLNPSNRGRPFADNGVIPAGENVAFIQKAGSLATILSGLTPGVAYGVRFRANSRTLNGTPGPNAAWSLNGGARMPFSAGCVDRPGVYKRPYHTISGSFVATSHTAALQVFAQSTIDTALLLDAFTIAPMHIVVTTTNDGGHGSLRRAIAEIPPGGTITFASHLSGAAILLTNGVLDVKTSLAIDASALPGGIMLDGDAHTTIFRFPKGGTNTLRALTIVNAGMSIETDGGSIVNYGHLTLDRCTLAGNTGSGGGAIWNEGDLIANQSTFTGNRAYRLGGGAIHNGGLSQTNATAQLNHCTLAGNEDTSGEGGGGGGGIKSIGRLTLHNTIVAGNSSDNISGEFIATGTNLTAGKPGLAALGHHGGPVPTMPPLPGSPALDAAIGSTFTNDQRGFPRPAGAAADLGAVEVTPAK